jgi:hypothetical protein
MEALLSLNGFEAIENGARIAKTAQDAREMREMQRRCSKCPQVTMSAIRSVEAFMFRARLTALAAIVCLPLTTPLMAQGAPPQGGPDQPYTVEYYYKVQWGHQQEFLELFLKNHYPLLKRIAATGRILSVKIDAPAYHTTEDGRWDYRVTIRYRNSTVATTANPEEEALIKELWPDQEKYKREEQRRFEILAAHWDLPVTEITPGQP